MIDLAGILAFQYYVSGIKHTCHAPVPCNFARISLAGHYQDLAGAFKVPENGLRCRGIVVPWAQHGYHT